MQRFSGVAEEEDSAGEREMGFDSRKEREKVRDRHGVASWR